MTRLALLRHGPTDWNRAGRVQGRTNIALGEAGAAVVRGLVAPAFLDGWRLVASPLVRAAETARLLFDREPEFDDRLVESSWGEWEGMTKDALGPIVAHPEARGLDFRPPGGESPHDVYDRVRRFLAEVAASGRDTVAVTHKGVLRVVYAKAVNWDMDRKPPQKMHDLCVHLYALDAVGVPRLERLNVPLAPS